MLRRWIPVTGVFAVAVLFITADTASAQIFQRLRGRRNGGYQDNNYVQVQPAGTASATTTTNASPAVATTTTTVSDNNNMVYQRSGLFGRRGRWVPANQQTASITGTNQTTRQAFYPPDASGNSPVQLVVRLPGNASLTIDGQQTTMTGSNRVFVSPALERGYQYTYEIQAKWMENGREVTRTRKVSFQPGQQVSVDLLTPTAEERN